MFVVSDYHVEDRHQLAHAGDHGDLEGFACGDEPCSANGLMIGVQRMAEIVATHRAGVAVERGHADQGGNLLAIELTPAPADRRRAGCGVRALRHAEDHGDVAT